MEPQFFNQLQSLIRSYLLEQSHVFGIDEKFVIFVMPMRSFEVIVSGGSIAVLSNRELLAAH